MKRNRFLALLAAGCMAASLAGCAAPESGQAGGAPAASWDPCAAGGSAAPQWRIVDGAEEGSLLLASQREGGGLCRLEVGELPVTLDGRPAGAADLRDGMLLNVQSDGAMREIWPEQFSEPLGIDAQSEGIDDRCGLVLQVFEDLWNTDEGLNEGAAKVGVDIDPALLPCEAERAGVAWRFGELHGLEPLQGTWQELADQGYIQEKGLVWEDGCFFAFHAAENAKPAAGRLAFDAQKWRGGTGAYYFQNCTATEARGGAGGWTYEVGAHAIA